MNIGIMTFHWATNHGAILQTYATQNYLQNQYPHHNVEIINYAPVYHRVNFAKSLKRTIREMDFYGIREYKKERELNHFRQSYLSLSPEYTSYSQLVQNQNLYNVVVFGSDQIWNPYFLQRGEGDYNDAYFGQFCSEKTKKVALSVSFGCKEYPVAVKDLAHSLIESFSGISVREKSAISILEDMGIMNAVQLPDPTVLLEEKDILALCKEVPASSDNIIAVNCIREKGKARNQLINAWKAHIPNGKVKNIQMLSIEKWLAAIRDSSVVITDSFHCVMMCLILHKDFVVIPAEGALSGMNDRFVTVLEPIGLLGRIQSADSDRGWNQPIKHWNAVDQHLQKEGERLKAFMDAQLFEKDDG